MSKLGFDNSRLNNPLLPNDMVTPQNLHDFILEVYGYDDNTMVYSNLWAQQLQGGNTTENFLAYLKMLGLKEQPSVTLEQNKNRVIELYRQFLQREPSENEITQSLNFISTGKSDDDIINMLKNSDEYVAFKRNKAMEEVSIKTEITQYFNSLLKRNPYPAELDKWWVYVKDKGSTQKLKDDIISSDEFKRKYTVVKGGGQEQLPIDDGGGDQILVGEKPPEKKTNIVPALVAGAVAVGAVLLS